MEIGRLNCVKVRIMGDLKHGRTVSSLSYMLDRFNGNSIA